MFGCIGRHRIRAEEPSLAGNFLGRRPPRLRRDVFVDNALKKLVDLLSRLRNAP